MPLVLLLPVGLLVLMAFITELYAIFIGNPP